MKENDKQKKKLNKNYGEFIPTEFNWVSLDKQKEIANKLNKVTKKKV